MLKTRLLMAVVMWMCATHITGCRNDGQIVIEPQITKASENSDYTGYAKAFETEMRIPKVSAWADESFPQYKARQGGRFLKSPDGKHVAFTTGGTSPFHNVVIMDPDTKQESVILSYRESDPGSGTSVWYRWSDDSKVLFIWGSCSSFTRRWSGTQIRLKLIYIVPEKKLLSVEFSTLTARRPVSDATLAMSLSVRDPVRVHALATPVPPARFRRLSPVRRASETAFGP